MQSKGNVGRLELRDSIGVVLRAVRSDVPGTASSSSRFARHGHGATVTRKSRDWSHVVVLLVQVLPEPSKPALAMIHDPQRIKASANHRRFFCDNKESAM